MSDNTIYKIIYAPFASDGQIPSNNEKEIWRYAGYSGVPGDEEAQLRELLAEVIKELEPVLEYRLCYRRMDLTWQEGLPVMPFPAESHDLAKCLKNSSEIIMFAATLGLEPDRRISRQRLYPAKALLMQAYCTERIEVLCNTFCRNMRQTANEQGLQTTPRFSPGYGDLPIGIQKDFIQLLDCNRKIGVTLNESLLMTPSKSITAIFGLYQEENS